MDDYEAIRQAVTNAEADTAPKRAAVYKRLTGDLESRISEAPAAFRKSLNERLKALRLAAREFEADARASKIRGPRAEGQTASRLSAADSTLANKAPLARPLSRARTITALTIRYLLLLSRQGPAAAAWMVIEPILQISFIVIAYALLGMTTIMDMEPLPFAVLGTSAWFMFRMAIVRISIAPVEAGLVLFPRIRLIDVLVARNIGIAIIYSCALLIVLSILGWTGNGAPVDRPLGVILAWITMIGLSFGFGTTFRGLVEYAPFLHRSVPWISRIIFFVSGVLFVSEQLPDFIAKPLLYNPLLNAVQELRSAYFTTYESVESSLFYAAAWAVGLIVAGLMFEAARTQRALIR